MPSKRKKAKSKPSKPSISINVKQVMNEKPDTVMIRPGRAPETFNPYSVFRGPQIHYVYPAPQAYANVPFAVRPIVPARDFIEYSRREPFQTDLRVDTNPNEVRPAMPTVRVMPSRPVVESSREVDDDDFLSTRIIIDRNIHQQTPYSRRAISSGPSVEQMEAAVEQVEYDAPRLLGGVPGATFKAVRALKKGGSVNKDDFGSAFIRWNPDGSSSVNPRMIGGSQYTVEGPFADVMRLK
jgi:hypothetical protein